MTRTPYFRPSVFLPPVTFDASPVEYHALGTSAQRGDVKRVMSRSELQKFARCPHAWIAGLPDEQTDCLAWGSLVDCLALTPDRFESVYAVAPATYSETGMKCETCGSVSDSQKCAKCKQPRVAVTIEKEWNWQTSHCRDWRKEREAEGKAVVKEAEVSEAWKAVKRLEQDPRISALMQCSQRQVQVCVDYHDEATGLVVPIKCLVDLLPDPASEFGTMIADLKTANNAAPGAWVRHCYDQGYHTQAALYMDAVNVAMGRKYETWAHVVSESSPPYEVGRRILSEEYLHLGRLSYLNALVFYCHCLKHNEWPGFDDREDLSGTLLDGWRVVEPLPYMLGL